jgi:hypothetical protein
MSGSGPVLSAKLADVASAVCAQEPKVTVPILVPISESEWTTQFRNSDFGSDPQPISNEARSKAVTDVPSFLAPRYIDRIRHGHEFERADSREPKIHQLNHAAESDTAAIFAPENLLHAFYRSKEEFAFNGWFVTASAVLILIAGIAAGIMWPLNSVSSSSTAASERLIVDRLNAITGELSSLRHDLEDVAASQRHVAEKQEQLSAAQASLAIAQEQASVKQHRMPSTRTNRPSKATRP